MTFPFLIFNTNNSKCASYYHYIDLTKIIEKSFKSSKLTFCCRSPANGSYRSNVTDGTLKKHFQHLWQKTCRFILIMTVHRI